MSPSKPSPSTRPAARRTRARTRRAWGVYAFLALTGVLTLVAGVLGYYYVSFSRMIDARLRGEMTRADPRVFARAYDLRAGQAMTPRELVERLNELGYTHRAKTEQAGEFTVGRDTLLLIPRDGARRGQLVRVAFTSRGPKAEPSGIDRLELVTRQQPIDGLRLDPPLITALVATGREKRRHVPIGIIPKRMVEAVLAIEDRRFFDHPGVDPIRIGGALVTNLFGDKPYLEGGSTLTQQLARNFFLTDQLAVEQATGRRSPLRKIQEQFMSIVLERRASKDQILELYLNDVPLGQRGSFAIHGVGEAARLFFGKDVTNVSLAEAATIAGVIQSPSRLSPFRNPEAARTRRNVVLRTMVEAGYISAEAAERASREPLQVAARALDAEAPYFVDHVSLELQERFRTLGGAVDVYTTLDLHLQRVAQDALRDGLARVDELLKRRRQSAQAALIAVDPRTGDVLAMVGGRSYNQSQFNRARSARRQPGSVFKPFVYLAAFEQAAANGRADVTPAMVVTDEPTTWTFNQRPWTPRNYDREYDGAITLRRALAMSRNVAAVKVAEEAGYEHVAALWRRVEAATPPRPYPSIALGVFEATPYEIAEAYTLFANGGVVRPLRSIARLAAAGVVHDLPAPAPKRIARADTTFLVTHMMRSVINEGTGAGARGAGFALDAAGKTGTTNDLRDAWFVGFTPELLAVVWVGLDDNQPLGLSGTQAALPIWTSFMTRALAGHPNVAFESPPGITFLDVDRDTGKLALAACPRVFREAFLEGTEPFEICHLHGF